MTHMVEEDLQWVRPEGPSCQPLCPASTRGARAEQGIILPPFSFRFWLSCSFGTAELQAACESLCLTATRGRILCQLNELFSGSTAFTALCGARDLFLYLIISAEKLCIYQTFSLIQGKQLLSCNLSLHGLNRTQVALKENSAKTSLDSVFNTPPAVNIQWLMVEEIKMCVPRRDKP